MVSRSSILLSSLTTDSSVCSKDAGDIRPVVIEECQPADTHARRRLETQILCVRCFMQVGARAVFDWTGASTGSQPLSSEVSIADTRSARRPWIATQTTGRHRRRRRKKGRGPCFGTAATRDPRRASQGVNAVAGWKVWENIIPVTRFMTSNMCDLSPHNRTQGCILNSSVCDSSLPGVVNTDFIYVYDPHHKPLRRRS